MKVLISTFILCLFSALAVAQNFNYKAKIEQTTTKGYSRIELTPAITSKMQANLNDVRLLDSQNELVPFILKSEQLSTTNNYYKSYPITDKQFNSKSEWRSEYTFVNPNADLINCIVLGIKNFSSTKYARLSGKENGQWFIIKDKIVLTVAEGENADSEEIQLNFPKSSYSNYKLEITDPYGKDPINIINIAT